MNFSQTLNDIGNKLDTMVASYKDGDRFISKDEIVDIVEVDGFIKGEQIFRIRTTPVNGDTIGEITESRIPKSSLVKLLQQQKFSKAV